MEYFDEKVKYYRSSTRNLHNDFGASAAIGSGQSQPFDPNEPSIRVGATEGTGGGHGGAAVILVLVCNLFTVEKSFHSGLTKWRQNNQGMKHMWSLCLIALVHMTNGRI